MVQWCFIVRPEVTVYRAEILNNRKTNLANALELVINNFFD